MGAGDHQLRVERKGATRARPCKAKEEKERAKNKTKHSVLRIEKIKTKKIRMSKKIKMEKMTINKSKVLATRVVVEESHRLVNQDSPALEENHHQVQGLKEVATTENLLKVEEVLQEERVAKRAKPPRTSRREPKAKKASDCELDIILNYD